MAKALLISCFDWYKARLEPIRIWLVSRNYEVVILESDFDHINKEQLKNKYPECTYLHVPEYKENLSIQRIKSHLSFGRQVKKYIDNFKPDMIYIQVPPNNTAEYCANYKKRYPDVKLILDIIDLWPESMPIGKVKNLQMINIWSNWRNNCIKVADHIFTECELYQEVLDLDMSITSTLYLFKEQKEEEKRLIEKHILQRTNNCEQTIIKFAYLGSMNNIIDIDGICKIIKQFIENGYECELHAIGDGENKEQFRQRVSETGCKSCFYGALFDETEKIRILAPCDYAFNMMKGNITVGLTIKSIDYLSYGIPLINNIKGDTWKLVEKESIGFNVTETLDFSSAIDHNTVIKCFETYFTRNQFNKQIGSVL